MPSHRWLSDGVLLCLALAMALSLLSRHFALQLFQLASLASLLYGLFLLSRRGRAGHWRPTYSPVAPLLLSLALLGLGKWAWALHFGIPDEDLAKNNLATGQRLLLAVPLLGFAYACRGRFSTRGKRLAALILLAGMGATLVVGLREHAASGLRLKLNTDAATTAAYLLTLLGVASLACIRAAFGRTWLSLGLSLAVVCACQWLLALTLTRSAILLAPCLFVLMLGGGHAHLGRRAWLLGACILLASCAFTAQTAWSRLAAIGPQWSSYQTDKSTSIGARLSLWKAGLEGTRHTLFGQTVEQRSEQVLDYLDTYEGGNRAAREAMRYHLHNELIDTLSLRGILAAVVLLAFYLTLLQLAWTTRSGALLAFSLAIILFGSSDVVLHQRLAGLMIGLTLALLLASLPPRAAKL